MEITDKDLKRFVIIILGAILVILSFMLLKPVIIPIFGGLILAYIFGPVEKFFSKYIKNRNLCISIVTVIALLIIFIPVWLITPVLINQIFEIFKVSQNIDVTSFLQSIFPNATNLFIAQTAISISTALSQLSSTIINALVGLLLDLPRILLYLSIVGFVFFFALRDKNELIEFMKGLSPINKARQELIVKQFKDITDSILYGQLVVGIIQGLVAGIGFLLFGVSNFWVLTIIAIIFSILPIVGPFLVWAPVNILMFATGNPTTAALFLAYNLLIVSTIDNFLRPYFVSRKSNLSAVLVIIGMIGGLFIFGIVGIVLGPLIIGYLVTFLRAYKDKTLSSLFSE